MMDSLKNVFIDKTLKHLLDGNKGSNILTVILVPVLAQHINWILAFKGFKFEDAAAVEEASKLVGVLVLALYGYFIGKKKPAAGA